MARCRETIRLSAMDLLPEELGDVLMFSKNWPA